MSYVGEPSSNTSKINFNSERVDTIYHGETPHENKRMAFAERVRALYSRENTPAAKKSKNGPIVQNGHPGAGYASNYMRFDLKDRDPRGYEKTIKYYDCLYHLMTACGLLLILFAIVVPICTIVLTVILGGQPLQVPGYLAPLLFVGVIVCVFLARSELKKINMFYLFVSMIILTIFAILLSLGLIIVGIVGLNRDSPDPYGHGAGVHPQLMEILSMECAQVSCGVVTLVVSSILLGISIYFAKGVYNYYVVPGQNTPSSDRTVTPDLRPVPVQPVVIPKASPKPEKKKAEPKKKTPEPKRSPSPPPLYTMQRAQTAPRTAVGSRPIPMVAVVEPERASSRATSQASVTQIDFGESYEPDDSLDVPDTPTTRGSSRRWGKTKNVLKAIMDIKQ